MIPLNSGAFKIKNTIGVLWCRLMHDDVTWPIHGHYQCRTCRRHYPVSWALNAVRGPVSSHPAPGLQFTRLHRTA